MEELITADYPIPTNQQLAGAIKELDRRLKKVEQAKVDLGVRTDNIAGKMGTTSDLNALASMIGVLARAIDGGGSPGLAPADQHVFTQLKQL